MYKIGYRIKLPAQKDMQEAFLARYSTLYNTFELKVNDDILCADCVESIISLTQAYNIPYYSFHLLKDVMYDEQSFAKTIEFLSYLSNCEVKSNIALVTHYISDDTLDISKLISLTAFENTCLCIENIEVFECLFEYLDALKKMVILLNCNVCLDIGHLFFSAVRCNIPIMQLINFLDKDIWWKSHIREIHLHDYNSEKCHLNIGKGLLDFSYLKSFLRENWPIILETKINDLSKDGIIELKYTKEGLG